MHVPIKGLQTMVCAAIRDLVNWGSLYVTGRASLRGARLVSLLVIDREIGVMILCP